jgi:predicted nucleotidyltransferase
MDSAPAFAEIQQNHPYPIAFATITGSHAFGYATDLSDYDIHGVHLLPVEHVLGLASGGDTVERKLTDREPEVDAATHDLKKFILLLLKGNGNILEDLYSPLVLHTSPLHEELKALGKGCITRMCAAHYAGMARNQQRRMQLNDVKKLLHTYRCLLMGIHLMRSGELEMRIVQLAKEYRHLQIVDLIMWKQSGIEGLSQGEMDDHLIAIGALHLQLDDEAAQSRLPERTPQTIRQELEHLLVRTRLEGR